MIQKPQLSRIAEAGIRELRRDHGIEPTLDEIIWLHELGKAQEAAGRIDGILEAPAQAGKAFLWPMTVMAAQWYRNYAQGWYRYSPLFAFYALAFALAHGRGMPVPDTEQRGWLERTVRRVCAIKEPKMLVDLLDREEATAAIERWVALTGATKKELEAAMDAVLAQTADDDEPAEQEGEPAPTAPTGINYDDIIHELAALSGTDPDYWRTRTSKDATIRAYINVTAIERARRGIAGGNTRDALSDAIQAFRKAMVKIIEAHKPKVQA